MSLNKPPRSGEQVRLTYALENGLSGELPQFGCGFFWRQFRGRCESRQQLDVDAAWAREKQRARQDMARPEMQALLDQDLEDLKALQVSRTPTFFVQGRSLPSFGPDQLAALVAEEVAKAKR